MRITLNGDARELPPGSPVSKAVDLSGAPSRSGVAVAVDGEVVPRSSWETMPLEDGQQVEVLQAVQGG